MLYILLMLCLFQIECKLIESREFVFITISFMLVILLEFNKVIKEID